MASQGFFKTGFWTLDCFTILISFAFLYIFLKIKDKTTGHYMVIVLTIADLLLHFQNMLILIFLPLQSDPNTWVFINLALYRFTLYWSTLIAIFIYLIIKQKKAFNPKKFLGVGFITCIVLACAFSLIVSENAWGIQVLYQHPSVWQIQCSLNDRTDQFLYFLFYQAIGAIVPILITLYCYFRNFEVLRVIDSPSESYLKASKLFLYCIMQILCFIPSIICEFIYALIGDPLPLTVSIVESCLYRVWAVFNVLVFLFFSSAYSQLAMEGSRRLSDISTMLTLDGAEVI